ncbi:kinase [Salmonella bongori]|nr:kinase [Salmonella bongori]
MTFGSIVNIPRDCSWPLNIFQSFFIFVNELFDEQRSWKQLWRSAPIHPFNLPQPWSNWLYAVWQKPVNAWSFTLLEQLFKTKDRLPVPESNISAIEQWIVAQETVLLENQTRQRDEAAHREQLSQQLYQLNTQVSQLQQDMVALAQARTESETFVAPETGPESLPTEIATLQEQLAAAHREIDHLSNINNELCHEIAKIHHSRSWRMTRGYRYAGLQIYLLRQYGFSLRCKHLIKRSLQFVFSFLRKHPNVKHSVGNALHKLGLYQPAIPALPPNESVTGKP